MTQFNPEQQLAIDALNSNVIVSASAGAGKTTVLVARLMKRILKDGVGISQIVAMTFTEAAASEMKVRLLDALNEEYTKNPSDFLQEQIALVETAQISTIHSFCLTIIKNYGYVLGIDPRRTQNILDDAMVKIFQNEAMHDVLNTWLENRFDTTIALLDLFSSNPLNFSAFFEAIQACSDWIQSKKNQDEAIQNVINVYRSNNLDAFPLTFRRFFILKTVEQLSEIKEMLQRMVAISDASFDYDDPKQSVFQAQTQKIASVSFELSKVIEKFESGDVSEYDTLPVILNFPMKASGKFEDYTNQRAEITDAIASFIEAFQPLQEVFNRNAAQSQNIEAILEFTRDYRKQYNQIKEKNNALDFGDFETLALEILRHNDYAIAKLMRPLYQEIMVDEFQDTNEYQDEIIRLISNGSNIFRVGDIKQSIYKFRGAKPSIMSDLLAEGKATNLYLSYNYRSKEDIVSYNNTVFENLMNLTHSMTYSSTDHVNTGVDNQKKDSHPVEFHIIERGDETYDEKANQQQANHIAQEIIKYSKLGYRFKDMVILVRGHAAKTYLKEAFEKTNIPHFIDDQSGFYASSIIKEVLQFLEFANDPHDYYLVKVLLSSFVGLTVDDIAALRLKSTDSIKEALKLDYPDIYDSIFNLIKTWKSKDIVSILLDIIGYKETYNSVLSLQDKTNLDFLLEKAVQYQSNNIPTLSGFMTFVRAFEKETSSEASPLSSEADVVTSMTIHKSKGLQFPIVFLWGMGPHRVRDHSSVLITDEELGIGLNNVTKDYRLVEKNLIRDIIEYKQNHEELEETLRLLYVALTRPQKHLIIVDALKEFKQVPLTKKLLFNHRRKSELLYAASPKERTVLKLINGLEIDTQHLDGEAPTIFNTFGFDGSTNSQETIYYNNPELDMSFISKEGMAFGSILHNALEVLPHRIWEDSDLSSFDETIQKRLKAYNMHPFTQELYTFDEIYHETSYMKEDGEGIIDFYAVKDDRIVLVDYKSDNATAQELFERYESQIKTYEEVLKQHYPLAQIETYIYSFKLDTYLQI